MPRTPNASKSLVGNIIGAIVAHFSTVPLNEIDKDVSIVNAIVQARKAAIKPRPAATTATATLPADGTAPPVAAATAKPKRVRPSRAKSGRGPGRPPKVATIPVAEAGATPAAGVVETPATPPATAVLPDQTAGEPDAVIEEPVGAPA